MEPVVLYSLATSGVAASTDVLELGDRNALNEIRIRMMATVLG